MIPVIVWTDERVDLLTRMWANGHSARAIAEALSHTCTRNAVLGKVDRLKLRRGPARPRPPASVPPPLPSAPLPEFRGVEIHPHVPGRCIYCGRTAQPGRDKCAEHITERIENMRPNKRAGFWTGLGSVA